MTLSGSFADREHRKWVEEAVVLPNNPYTTENIVRRLIFKLVFSFVGAFAKQPVHNRKYNLYVDYISQWNDSC